MQPNQNSIIKMNKKITITFKSDKKFYIGNQTLKSFVDALKKEDPDLIQVLPNGDLNGMRILHVKTNKLMHSDIANVTNKFVNRYDFLKIHFAATK